MGLYDKNLVQKMAMAGCCKNMSKNEQKIKKQTSKKSLSVCVCIYVYTYT